MYVLQNGCKSAHVLLWSFFQNPSQNDVLDEKAVDTEADKQPG